MYISREDKGSNSRKRERKASIESKWTFSTLNGYMDGRYAACIPLFAISSPVAHIANQPQHFSYCARVWS